MEWAFFAHKSVARLVHAITAIFISNINTFLKRKGPKCNDKNGKKKNFK